jgi:hypothetical protein
MNATWGAAARDACEVAIEAMDAWMAVSELSTVDVPTGVFAMSSSPGSVSTEGDRN